MLVDAILLACLHARCCNLTGLRASSLLQSYWLACLLCRFIPRQQRYAGCLAPPGCDHQPADVRLNEPILTMNCGCFARFASKICHLFECRPLPTDPLVWQGDQQRLLRQLSTQYRCGMVCHLEGGVTSMTIWVQLFGTRAAGLCSATCAMAADHHCAHHYGGGLSGKTAVTSHGRP